MADSKTTHEQIADALLTIDLVSTPANDDGQGFQDLVEDIKQRVEQFLSSNG